MGTIIFCPWGKCSRSNPEQINDQTVFNSLYFKSVGIWDHSVKEDHTISFTVCYFIWDKSLLSILVLLLCAVLGVGEVKQTKMFLFWTE